MTPDRMVSALWEGGREGGGGRERGREGERGVCVR